MHRILYHTSLRRHCYRSWFWRSCVWPEGSRHLPQTLHANSGAPFEIKKQLYPEKNFVFWDAASCRSCVNRRFGGTYHIHLQGRKIRERRTSVSSWLQPRSTYLRMHVSHTSGTKRLCMECLDFQEWGPWNDPADNNSNQSCRATRWIQSAFVRPNMKAVK
jgi:hypothetical protein